LPAHCGRAAGGSATDACDNATSSPSTPTTPGSVPTAASTSTAGAAAGPSNAAHTVQETTKTSEQVYVTHATVAAAAAAAGGLVGGVHIPIRTAANVAETALDPAAVVDFDCASPTAPAGAGAASTAAISPHTPAAGLEAAPPSSPGQQLQGHAEPTGASLAATTVSTGHQGAAVQDSSSGEGGEGIAGHAVLPEDRDEVAATLQRLRITGQLPGPHSTSPAGYGAAAAATPDTADLFVGTSTTATTSSSGSHRGTSSNSTSTSKPSSGAASSSFAGAAGHPSAQGVSAATAAPAKAGYPDPTSAAATVETSPELSAGMQPAAGSSGAILAMHDAAARAAAVAGALVHIGQPVTTAAALAGTATQPAQAVEAASGMEESSPATSTAARVGSLHQQHTLAEFLLDESADAAISAEHRSDLSATAGAAGSFDDQPDLSAAAAAAAGGDDDVEVQLDVGRSTRLLGSDGRVATAAAAVPEEALAAIQADTAGLSDAPSSSKTPQHPSLRQLSLSSRAHEQAQPTGQLPYGLKVADIVAATIASEERRFRVMSPRSSPVGATSPRSGRDSFFTASSGSNPSTPRADTPAPAVERSSSPLSASATRAIFESVQLAVQQEQLAGAVTRSNSLGPVKQQQATGPTAGGEAADASVTGRMSSSGSGDSTATSSRSAAASESAAAAADPAQAGADAPFTGMTGSSSSASGGPAGAAAAAVAEENAAVMQEMMLHELAEGTAAASGGPAVRMADAESSASTASLCGDSDDYKAGAVSSTAVSEVPSSNVSAGDRLAAAVAAEAANDIGAAATGMDVAATAAPAFRAVLFGPGPMPVDVAASRSPASADSAAGSMGLGSAVADPFEAAALTSAGMEALAGPAAQHAIPVAVGVVSALQHVVDATSTAVISSAGMDGAAVAAATAASAATERHAGGADPLAAAQDAAQLVVDAARAVPGLLEPSEVASAAAAAGAAAAAAATPGMDAAAAAAACAAAAAAPLADPASVGAAAAQAVAATDTGAAALPTVSTPVTSAGQTPIFAPMSTPMQPPAQAVICQSGMVGLADSSPQGVQAATVDDLSGLLPILAPSGHVGDTVILTGPAAEEAKELSAPAAFDGSSALLSTGAGGGAPAAAAWNASAPGQLHSILEGSESGAAGSAGGYLQPAADVSAATSAGGTTEVLNAEGLSQSRMFDPLIVQLALASSVPLEGLGLDAALVDVSGAVAGAGRDTSRSSSMARGSGTLMMQQHPLAGVESLGISTSLGPGPAEGGNVLTHLAAAAAAMSELDSKLQRQRTDSISLGAGYSSRPGELDAALAAMAGSAAAEAPAGPTDEGFEGDSSSVQV